MAYNDAKLLRCRAGDGPLGAAAPQSGIHAFHDIVDRGQPSENMGRQSTVGDLIGNLSRMDCDKQCRMLLLS